MVKDVRLVGERKTYNIFPCRSEVRSGFLLTVTHEHYIGVFVLVLVLNVIVNEDPKVQSTNIPRSRCCIRNTSFFGPSGKGWPLPSSLIPMRRALRLTRGSHMVELDRCGRGCFGPESRSYARLIMRSSTGVTLDLLRPASTCFDP